MNTEILKIKQGNNVTQMIVLCGTREQCRIIGDEIFVMKPNNVTMHVFDNVSTLPFMKQALLNNPHIIVGTVTRIYDLLDRGLLKTFNVKSYIVSNIQEIEERGFKPFLDAILPNANIVYQ